MIYEDPELERMRQEVYDEEEAKKLMLVLGGLAFWALLAGIGWGVWRILR